MLSSLVPLLAVGIPANALMALLAGAVLVHGIVPGPQIMTKQPALFWGTISSMWIGNALLVVINVPLIGLWLRRLRVPYRLLLPAIVLLCCIGIYTVNDNSADVAVAALFGLFGYALIRFGFELSPLLLALVLGKLMEEKLRQALTLSRGSFMTFFDASDKPAPYLLAIAAGVLIVAVLSSIRQSRDKVFTE
jgi:putative tricarboxylic transport membrane protein